MDIIKFTPEELRSIALWDAWCEAMPLTEQERRECNERDSYCTTTSLTHATAAPITDAQRKKNREYAATYRRRHRDAARAYYAAHREEIKAQKQEYYKFTVKGRIEENGAYV